MKNLKQARVIKLSFLFLAISLLVLFSPYAGKAQNNSTVNLVGTVWNRTPQFIEFPSDGTFATLRYSYVFERQGKVKYALSTIKPAGQESRHGYNSITGRVELIRVPTISLDTLQTFDGTYESEGKSLYLDFPAYTVSATIYSDSMKGELTWKKTNKKEEWTVQRKSNQPNDSTEKSPYPNVKEGNKSAAPSDSVRRARALVALDEIEENRFAAPADSPMIGTWKYVECVNNDCSLYYKPVIVRTSTFIYLQNGVVESRHERKHFPIQIVKGNWKYTPKTASSGILDEYQGEDLLERANVKFLGRNQLEYTVTFSQDSNLVGTKYIWTRE